MKVLIPQDVNDAGKQYLRDRGYDVVVGQGWDVARVKQEITDCDAVLARTMPYPADVIAAGKKLKVIARFGVGTDNIDLKAAEAQGVWVTIAKGANSRSVAEHVVMMMLACARNLYRCDRETRAGNWEIRNTLPGVELHGKVLAIFGLGSIGLHLAHIAHHGLGMRIMGNDLFVSPTLPDYITVEKDKDALFALADVISLHVPALPDTLNMVNERTLRLMKPTAYLINCARGGVVDEEALYDALQKDVIAGAATDVFAVEPAPASTKLFALPNLVLSPHNGALTNDANVAVALSCAKAIDDVLSGRKPEFPVTHPTEGGRT